MSLVAIRRKKSGSQKKPLFIVISKACIKSAAKRNLVRRRVRAIMRSIVGRESADYCVVVRKGADVVSFEDLRRDVSDALRQRREQ